MIVVCSLGFSQQSLINLKDIFHKNIKSIQTINRLLKSTLVLYFKLYIYFKVCIQEGCTLVYMQGFGGFRLITLLPVWANFMAALKGSWFSWKSLKKSKTEGWVRENSLSRREDRAISCRADGTVGAGGGGIKLVACRTCPLPSCINKEGTET